MLIFIKTNNLKSIETIIQKAEKSTISLYPIRTAAQILGISIETLRMYEKEGLITPHKSTGNQRVYSEDDLERLRSIR